MSDAETLAAPAVNKYHSQCGYFDVDPGSLAPFGLGLMYIVVVTRIQTSSKVASRTLGTRKF